MIRAQRTVFNQTVFNQTVRSDQFNAAQSDWCGSQFVKGGGEVLGMWGAWGGVGSEGQSSVVRGVKRGGGARTGGVQLPDSLVYEAVLQSAGPRLETPKSPPWWQQTEKLVCRVGGITCNAEGFAGETGAVDVLEGGERDTNDLLSCSHYPLKGLAAGCVASAIHTVMQLLCNT